MKEYKVGLGFDVHKISKKKKDLILGGAKIPCAISLEAVSDGDVVLHAISDALCGALGLGDIGDYFPPSDKKSKDLDSKTILKFILKKGGKFSLINLDITIVADKPRLVMHKQKILSSLKKIFSKGQINLKVKSKEGLNILGGTNSISCLTTVLVKK